MTTREARVWNPQTGQWELVGTAPGDKGPQGDPGPKGDPGDVGPSGKDGKDGTNGKDGKDGTNGKDGAAATIAVGKTDTLPPGSKATVVNSGTAAAAVFDFGIPRGFDGNGSGGDTPVGAVLPFVGTVAPTGWLMCDGSNVDAGAYPQLATMLAPFGGKTPDLRNRFPMGAGTHALGAAGGSNTIDKPPAHTHAVTGSVAVDVADAVHSHPGSSASGGTVTGSVVVNGSTGAANTSHAHDSCISTSQTFVRNGSAIGGVPQQSSSGFYTTQGGQQHTHDFNASGNIQNGAVSGVSVNVAQGNAAHGHTGSLSNAQAAASGPSTVDVTNPFVALNYIIKAA